MNELILTIATTLSVTPMDVYIIVSWVIFWGIFLALGIQKTYEAYFGLIVGLAIFIMLSVLLSPAYQTPETAKIFSPEFSGFLVRSSAYLIFILFLLTPISGGIRFPQTSAKILRIIEHIIISFFVGVLLIALVIGFVSKTYVFSVETGFILLKKFEVFRQILSGIIFQEIAGNVQPIVLFGVLFLLYKLLFSEIVQTLLMAFWGWLVSLRKKWGGSTAPASEEHFDEMHDEFDDHEEAMDDHGHGHH